MKPNVELVLRITFWSFCVLSISDEAEGTFGQIRDFFDRFFGTAAPNNSSSRKNIASTLPPTTSATPVKPQKMIIDFSQKGLKIHLTESYPFPTTPNSTEEFIKWEALEEKKYAAEILRKLSEPSDTKFDTDAKTLIANLVVNAVLDNVTHDIGGDNNETGQRNVSERRSDGEAALSSIVEDAPADNTNQFGEWTYENFNNYQQSQQQPDQSQEAIQSQNQQYEVPPEAQVIPPVQASTNNLNAGYPQISPEQGDITPGQQSNNPQVSYPNPIPNPGDPNYQAFLEAYYPQLSAEPPTTVASYLGVLNSIRNALTAATGNDTKALQVSPLNSVLNLLGPRGPRTTPSPDETTEYYVVPVNPSTEKNSISSHQEDLLGQVGRLRENVGKRNITGVIDESLKLASLQTVGVFVTNFLDLVLCNPIDRWNGMCNV